MEKLYIYVSTIMLSYFSYVCASNDYVLVGSLLSLLSIFVISKIYKYESGEEVNKSYKSLPIVKAMHFVTKDKGILNNQNRKSLFLLLLVSSFALSTIISINLFTDHARLLLIFLGCATYSYVFARLMITRFIQNNKKQFKSISLASQTPQKSKTQN